jgi:hypothetical protein
MANLRANNVCGTDGRNAITGSVEFDGNDYLSLTSTDFAFGTGDFTLEFWFYDASPTSGIRRWVTSTLGAFDSSTFVIGETSGSITFKGGAQTVAYPKSNSWSHIAYTRKNGIEYIFYNGVLLTSVSSTSNYTDTTLFIGGYYNANGLEYTQGFISNLRVIKGTALYTSNFIPPTNKLKNLPGTVLLCCQDSNNPTTEATGKTITANGDPTATKQVPQVGSDGSVEFAGPTKINTPNYFYLPTGPTEQRGRGRGVFGGGQNPSTSMNTIDYINIQSTGIAQDFGDLTVGRQLGLSGGTSSSTRGAFGGGFGNSPLTTVNVIDYITISSTSNALDFGDLTSARFNHSSLSNSTRGVFGGGGTPGDVNTIDFITISSTGNATDFGDLTAPSSGGGAVSSPTRGVFALGRAPSDSNILEYITISSTGNSQDFGDLTVVVYSPGCCSSNIRGLFAGNNNPSGSNNIDYITIASTGNAIKFGDLTRSGNSFGGTSNSIRGVFAGGYTLTPTIVNIIDYVTISSTGNASDFGDLTVARRTLGACSDSHGGLG